MDAGADQAPNPRLDRQLEKLDRLAELGLEIAVALAAQAKGAGPQVVEGDVALAYDRVSRAVRMAVMLQSRLVDEARVEREKAAKAVPEPVDPAAARKDAVARVVQRVAQADDRLDGFQVARARTEARERLEHDDVYGEVMSRPVSDLVAAICRDFGLAPDWARLAEEAWAQEEIESGEAGEPLRGIFAAFTPPDPPGSLPTLDVHLQALAGDPGVLAAVRRASG